MLEKVDVGTRSRVWICDLSQHRLLPFVFDVLFEKEWNKMTDNLGALYSIFLRKCSGLMVSALGNGTDSPLLVHNFIVMLGMFDLVPSMYWRRWNWHDPFSPSAHLTGNMPMSIALEFPTIS